MCWNSSRVDVSEHVEIFVAVRDSEKEKAVTVLFGGWKVGIFIICTDAYRSGGDGVSFFFVELKVR